MRTALRIVAWINTVFQGLVGVVSVVSPPTAASLFKLELAGPPMAALVRMFGGLLASSAIVSALIALDPDGNPRFRRGLAVMLLLNLGADVVVIAAGELRFDQLAVGMGLELVLAALLLAYRPR